VRKERKGSGEKNDKMRGINLPTVVVTSENLNFKFWYVHERKL
jgi:hypothetical protein